MEDFEDDDDFQDEPKKVINISGKVTPTKPMFKPLKPLGLFKNKGNDNFKVKGRRKSEDSAIFCKFNERLI